MPIVDLQRSLRRLGRIRMGHRVRGSSRASERPAMLETWRLTSPALGLLEAAASVYGGEPAEWANAPGSGKQWELVTETDTLDVIVPPNDMALSQHYELWSAGGGCLRRCDGVTEQLSGESCMCPSDAAARNAAAAKGEACRMTTRCFVLLPRVPDIGMWHLESHGFSAATELAGSIEMLRLATAASGALVPARLRIDRRQRRAEGATIAWGVPVLELGISVAALMGGEGRMVVGPDAAIEAAQTESQAPRQPEPLELPEAWRPFAPDEGIAKARFDLKRRLDAIEPEVVRREAKQEFLGRFGHPPSELGADQVADADGFVAEYEAKNEMSDA